MAHLLHLDSSAVAAGSTSRDIAATFRRAWADEHPGGTVTHRDLGTDPVPHLTEAGITAGFTPVEARTTAQVEATALRDELAGELLAADALLVTAPMYNWTIPSSLKAWIDQVLIPDRTLMLRGEPGPLAGRAVTVVLTYGGDYSPGSPSAARDHVEPYLRTVFADALGMDLTVITAQLTLAPRIPAMAPLAPIADASRAAAHLAAEERGRKTAAALAA